MATITATEGVDSLFGTGDNDEILGLGGDDRLTAGAGSDILNGGSGTDIADYSALNENIILTPGGGVTKSGGGNDLLIGIETIFGNTNRVNAIDASSAGAGAGINVDLSTNSLQVLIPGLGIRNFTVENFSDIIGTNSNSRFVGNDRNNRITGGAGNDTIVGSKGSDTLNGGGADKFILGDRRGAFYLSNGSNDYATITDFNVFQDSIDIGNLKEYSFALEGSNTIDLFSGKDVNTRDLIAKIQLADLGLAATKKGSSINSRSMMSMASMSSILDTGASTGVDALAAKIDILSGANSTADVVI
jgi:Ca2+-binding RTX toxin-like protein